MAPADGENDLTLMVTSSARSLGTSDLAAIVVCYWPGKVLRTSVSSLTRMSARPRIILVNNAPGDPLPGEVARKSKSVTLLETGDNAGFCSAVNLALRQVEEPYVAIVNPDAVVSRDFASILIAQMANDPAIASAGGRILRMDTNGQTTGRIDSLGLALLRGRRPADIGHGEPDRGTGVGPRDVFGVTGAAVIFRRQALDAVAVGGEILPNNFFMYLDDVDLAWRLRAAGFRAIVDPAAVAWHVRAHAGPIRPVPERRLRHLISTARSEFRRPDYARQLSWVNQLLMLVRNDDPSPFLRQLPYFVLRRLPLDLFTVVQNPRLALRARMRFVRLLPAAVRQRRGIRRLRKASADIGRWIL